MKIQNGFFQKTGIALLLLFSSSALLAKNIATEQLSDSLSMSPTIGYDSASLRISSNDYVKSQSFQSGESISMSLQGLNDGLYHYSLTLITASVVEGKDPSEASQPGQFRIINGSASTYNDEIANAEADAGHVANLPNNTTETN